MSNILRNVCYTSHAEIKRILQKYKHHENGKFNISCCNFAGITGKYNKSDKRKFVVSSGTKKKEQQNDGIKKCMHYNIKKKKVDENDKNVYLNRISINEKEKTHFFEKNEIVETNNIKNINVRDLLHKNGIYYLYTYQYVLMELLRYNNILVNVVYSDCVISYIINSIYKVRSAKYDSSFGTKDKVNMKNTNVQNVYSEKEKRNRKKEKQIIYTDNCVLLVGCSQEQTSLLYKTVMKLKSEKISAFIISNEANATNIQSNIFLYNIIVLNLENFQDDYDFSMLLGHMIFIAIDDIYEIYKKKKQNTLKSLLKNCREKQEHGECLQILLIDKSHDEWVNNDMIHFLRSLKYDVLSKQVSASQAIAQGGNICRSFGNDAFDRGMVNCGTLGENGEACPPFHYFNLSEYKKSNCRHLSIDAPLNEDKKFLILFYLLKTNKGKKILIYYSKSDIYTFYTLLNSYIPCVFISSSYKTSCKSNIVNVFNKRDDYVLITDDKNVQKLHQVNADLYIHYTFHECVNSYVDMLSSRVTAPREESPGEESPGEASPGEESPGEASPGEASHGEESPGMSVRSKYMRDREDLQSRSKYPPKGICQSILFYNRRVIKQYEMLDRLLGFTTYVLPPIREMKNMFLDFIIEEIKNVVIEDSKHMEEANRICKKYGHYFISASLYYIQKKKFYVKRLKKKDYKNVTFIIEKNLLLNKKKKEIDFLNHLLNYEKNIGDINLFMQNYLYCKRGYILSLPENIYNIIHKNKSTKENEDKYSNIHMYILYNNYEKNFRTTYVHKGQYKSKKSRRRLKKRMNMKREQMEMSRLRNRMISTFKMGARNMKM
ncbi:conserved Plasmodium protein, unknown function [Plasmodium ovale]|uniref:Uncharacterized protein n=1 Tax=Plasmodium ovale TaxID=36330 RepID=A0A1D3THN4_PLAOA|nr:conserved Plasmodium protein, unknown function [Plasmodium ovale]